MICVSQLMKTDIVTLDEHASLSDIHQLMSKKNIRHIPIVSEGDFLGIVSHRDLLSATPVLSENKKRIYSNTRAWDIMRTGVATVAPTTRASDAASMLEELKIGCLPVIDDGKLVGIITGTDFISTARKLIERLEETVFHR